MSVQTGSMTNTNVQLALYRFYVNASDYELKEAGVTRDEVLFLARSTENGSGYLDTELATVAKQMIAAYRTGKSSKSEEK